VTRREVRLQGLGGQGVITAGHLIGEAVSLHDREYAVMTEDYSPYVTGGWSRADVVISHESIDYPLVTKPDVLLAMSQDALDENWQITQPNATIIVDAGLVKTPDVKGRRVFAVPALSTAEELGRKVVANIIMLGFLTASCKLASREAMVTAITKRYPKATELNRQAFDRGYALSPQGGS